MLTKETKARIDRARDILVGQLPLPSDQVELITIALIYKFMDDIDEESRSLGGKPTFFVGELRDLNWRSLIANTLSAGERVTRFIQGIEAVSTAKHIPELFKSIFKNTFLKFRDGRILKLFLDEINGFAYDHSEELGNAFEYLLDTMGAQGDNGQFRTPRNIIDFIVDVVDPQKEDTILDPACGTAGFLISAYKHILEANTSPVLPGEGSAAVSEGPAAACGKGQTAAAGSATTAALRRLGDLLTGAQRKRLTENIIGYDITPLMSRLSRVNMYLHHFANPVVHDYDTLTNDQRWDEKYDCILANPPFMSPNGGVSTHSRFRIAAKRTEVLFADYILEHLMPGGKAGFVVPEGIIFQNNDDYVALRKWLINEAGLWAVVSLPAQIFQPYSGVKTSVLLIDRALARRRNDVLLVKVENDGFSLNTNRNPIPENDLPAALKLLTTARRADYVAQLAALNSPLQHQLVPREDFAKLDAYKAGTAAFDFCRKFRTRADKAEKTLAEARAQKNAEDAAKAEKSLAAIRKEFSTVTGLGALPDTLAELKTRFETMLKEPAIAYGADAKAETALTVALKEHLDNQRDYSLTLDRQESLTTVAMLHALVELGEICEMYQPQTISGRDMIADGPYPVFGANGLIGRYDKYNHEKPEVLMTCRGATCGTINVSEPRSWITGNSMVITPKDDRIDKAFLRWVLELHPNKAPVITGSAQPQITRTSLTSLRIPLPPLDEQRAMVAELESYQRVVDGCTALLASHCIRFLPDPDWPTEALGSIAELKNGISYLAENRGRGMKVVSVADFADNLITPIDGLDEINPTGVVRNSDLLHDGDILFVRSNGNKKLVGRSMLVQPGKERVTHSAFTIRLRFTEPNIVPMFYALLFKHPDYREQLTGRGANISNLSQDLLSSLVVPIPPVEVQQAIVADLQREQATLAGVRELKAKFEARITARLAAVWGTAPALESNPAPAEAAAEPALLT